MRRALVDLIVQGVETSRDFHIRVMDDGDFRRGAIDSQWLERRLTSILQRKPGEESVRVAAITGALLAERDKAARVVTQAAVEPTLATGGNGVALESWKQAARTEGLRS
jgi:acetyl-CoA carboxylase biotin carboxylase subunit